MFVMDPSVTPDEVHANFVDWPTAIEEGDTLSSQVGFAVVACGALGTANVVCVDGVVVACVLVALSLAGTVATVD